MTKPSEPTSMKNIFDKQGLKNFVAKMMETSPEKLAAQEQVTRLAEKIKEDMTQNVSPVQDEIFAEFATDLCRTTMFFPDNPHRGTDTSSVDLTIPTQWGTMNYRGPRLNTKHEDVFLAVTALMSRSGNKYAYSGPFLRLLKLLGKPTPGGKDYKSVFSMLEALKEASFRITTSRFKSKAGLIGDVVIDEETGELHIIMDQLYVDVFMSNDSNYYSLIELKGRLAIKGSVAKALFRFVCSQSRGWEGPWKHLAIALNMMSKDTSDPARHAQIRHRLRQAITTLINAGKLEKTSGFEGDRIKLVVVPLKMHKQLKH